MYKLDFANERPKCVCAGYAMINSSIRIVKK
jgi:hypothetical protein